MKIWSAVLLFAASVAFATVPAAAEDAVVAKVDGAEIKQSDLDFAASEVGSQLGNYPEADRKRMLLQFVIENQLMAAAAEKDTLDKAADFEARLAYHKRRALRDAYYEKNVRGGVSEDQAKKLYEEKIGGVKPEPEIHARHILVDTEEEAKAIAERLNKGEDFATLAKEKSKDKNADGGDLGFFGKGQMLKPFEDAAFALEVGKISEPVKTQFGWHIIKIEGVRTKSLPPFEQVKDQAARYVSQKAEQDAILQLHNAAKIELFDADGKPLPPATVAPTDPSKAAPAGADKPKTP